MSRGCRTHPVQGSRDRHGRRAARPWVMAKITATVPSTA